MASLPEEGSPKAARILAAAGELLLARGTRGVTVADVAQRAHVGKGTVYLYWETKEDLLLGLVARDFIALNDAFCDDLAGDPDLIRPSRMCPRLLEDAATGHPFVRAMEQHDELLGALVDEPRATELVETLGANAVTCRLLPIWREHGLARTDWALDEQSMALGAVMAGFVGVATGTRPGRHDADPATVLGATVTALLGEEHAGAAQVSAASAEYTDAVAMQRRTVLALLGDRTPRRS